MERKPAVAGYFYEAEPDKLLERIRWSINHELGPRREVGERRYRDIVGVVAPHAGYVYSGPVAAHAYAELAAYGKPDAVIVVGPNHYGIGAPVSIMVKGRWATPLGTVEIDSELANAIAARYRALEEDPFSFSKEHSIEVHLPFIQYFFPGAKFVPIAMWRQTISTARELGAAIAEAARGSGRRVYVVASSDLNHYEPHEVTVEKDGKVIDAALSLDEEAFLRAMEKYDVSVCGYGPIMALLVAAKRLGSTRAVLLKHATSGDTSGYRLETVGYASIAFYME